MVFDVEIYEIVKKKLSFKETKGGILIKNKKFMLDGSVIEVASEEVEPPKSISTPQIVNQINDTIKRWETFDPDPSIAASLLGKFKLTSKKKYPIFEEKVGVSRVGSIDMPTYEYVTIDDSGRKVNISSLYFIPVSQGLIGQRQEERDTRLTYTGEYQEMPILRR